LFSEINGAETRAFCAGEKDSLDCFADEKNRLFVMELLLHCSDISNPFKPYKLCSKWADLVVEEVGSDDLTYALDDPSPSSTSSSSSSSSYSSPHL
jgi:hypothetical protein